MQDTQTINLSNFNSNSLMVIDKQNAMVNAVQMAKPFRKKPADWLRLSSAKKFFAALSSIRNIPVESLVISVKGNFANGAEQGTWLHEDAAAEFARWLSPAFGIWCNDQIKMINTFGNKALINGFLQIEVTANEQARILDYHDNVLQSRTLIPTNIIAKELGMSAFALNKLLNEKKIIYKSNEHWVLYAEYAGKDYTGTKTVFFKDSAGNYGSNIHTYWTEKGRAFIHAIIDEVHKAA